MSDTVMDEHVAALPHYWAAGFLYATAGVLAAASALCWGIVLRNLTRPAPPPRT